jgi:cytochrome c peroxidase
MRIIGFALSLVLLTMVSCVSDNNDPKGVDLTDIPYDPQPYEIEYPDFFPDLVTPPDNPLTYDGVQLGRHLFYDPILSIDSSMTCVSCHDPKKAFTDGRAVSPGVDGVLGKRSAMSLVNLGFQTKDFFWDGRSPSLEHQAILPIEDPLELQDDWDNVERKLERSPLYRELFRKAFGIQNSEEITRDLAANALGQFQRIIISGNAKFDREQQRKTFFTVEEQEGFDMFFDTSRVFPDAECGHCHNWPLFTTNEFFNNGLDSSSTLTTFPDPGRGGVTNYLFDNGLFRATTLRNIELTAPYMHDGRFQTLEEVLDHYNSGGHYSETRDPLIKPLGLTERQKSSIIAFLKTLTDTSYLRNPDVLSPFE